MTTPAATAAAIRPGTSVTKITNHDAEDLLFDLGDRSLWVQTMVRILLDEAATTGISGSVITEIQLDPANEEWDFYANPYPDGSLDLIFSVASHAIDARTSSALVIASAMKDDEDDDDEDAEDDALCPPLDPGFIPPSGVPTVPVTDGYLS